MTDKWKGKAISILGHPVAVVDVTINRTILIDAQVYEEIGGLLRNGDGDIEKSSGLKEVAEFYDMLHQLPTKALPFVNVPWTEADSQEIGMRTFSEILKRFDTRRFWRVEGSAAEGYRGYLNITGIDYFVDLSESEIPNVLQRIKDSKVKVEASYAANLITKEMKDVLDAMLLCANKDSLECAQRILEYKDFQDRQKEAELSRIRDEDRNREGFGGAGNPPGNQGGRFDRRAEPF